MAEKKSAGGNKKKNYLPLIFLVVFLLAVVVAMIFFNTNDGNGINFLDPSDKEDIDSANGEDFVNGGNGEAKDSYGDGGNNDSSVVFDSEEDFFDEELEKTVNDWIVSQIGHEEFVLRLSFDLPDSPEALDAYKEDTVFVYRTELSEGGGRSVLIGEPYSDAFFRLEMEEVEGNWIIKEEIDLWE